MSIQQNIDGVHVWNKASLSGPSGSPNATKQSRQSEQTK